MKANPTTTTILTLAAAAAFVTGCAGASPYKASDPSYSDSASEAPAAQPSLGYGQPGGAADAEGEDFGPSAGYPAPEPSPAPAEQARRSADDDGGARPGADRDPFSLDREERRPGLATQWGERRFSRVTTAPFVRADRTHPFAVNKLFYNDPQGIAAMTDTRGSIVDHMRRFPVGSGHVEMGVKDGSGRFLTGFQMNGDNFVTGIKGHRYSIVIKNHSPGRIEAVVSVDGLDVIDGKDASFTKRGYLIDPHGDLEIDGWRTGNEEVAAFRFGSVSSSYSNKKHGKTRNVGVIGLALFHERGDSPRFWGSPRTHGDVVRRQTADPFPNRFASPPN